MCCRELWYSIPLVVLLAPAGGCSGMRPAVPRAAATAKPMRPDTEPGLVGWWKFDEVTGKRAADSSGHGRDGRLEGGLSFDADSVPGRIDKAIEIDGRDRYIQVTGYKGITGTRARTVAAWVKTTEPKGKIVSWGMDDYGKMWTFGFIRSHIGVTPNGGYLYIAAEVHDGVWHHVAAVVEEADSPNLYDNVKLYMDGTLQEIHDIGLLDLWPIETGSHLDVSIGKGLDGLIDDVRIYDRALSEDEIKAVAGSPGTR